MSFFAELKRRNVVRVGIAYVVIGWALAQVAEFAVDNFHAPEWTLQIFVIFLLLGLPLVLFLSWAFEMTRDGVKREKDVDRSESIAPRTGRKLDRTVIAVLGVAVVMLLAKELYVDNDGVAKNEVPVAAALHSIAILPFTNMSEDNDNFSDGLSEELLNLLAKMPDLKVAGRTSSFAFKGRNEDLRLIGDSLGVNHVLEGSVRRSGDRLRITAQLIKVEDGFHVWSETYDRQMADIFDIQDDVAGAIADALKLRLAATSDRPTGNPEAYASYLEALSYLDYEIANWSDPALERVNRAIELDPGFAKALTLKAEIYWFAGGDTMPSLEARAQAYAAASQALALDSTLLGARAFMVSSDPERTSPLLEIGAFEALVEEEPTLLSGLHPLAWLFQETGYSSDALRYADRIISINPTVSYNYIRRGESLLALGRREEARAAWRKAADMGSGIYAFRFIGIDHLINGEDEAAIVAFEKLFEVTGKDPRTVRPFIAGGRNVETGPALVREWVEQELSGATTSWGQIEAYLWYLGFGLVDDYWTAIDLMSGGSKTVGWTDAGNPLRSGVVFRASGFTRHPKFLEYAIASGISDLWDARGAPDFCSKASGEWVCE
jgi:TolB-like protein